MKPSLPVLRIAVTMGDPAGVGPELCLKILHEPHPFVPIILGDASVLQRVAKHLATTLPAPVVSLQQWQSDPQSIRVPTVVDLAQVDADALTPGIVTAANGRASYAYIQAAIDAALARHVDAVVTGPINKESIFQAGIRMPGHTEMFAARCGVTRWCMMQYSEAITCTFVTVHVGYAEVPALLTESRILDVIQLTAEALQRLRGRPAQLVVCGLNPHAGEHGLFGDREEERVISPAIEQARQLGLLVEGPIPPDTAFLPAKRATTDAFVCMYHDQGHIPVKALAFDRAVNTTLGLPIIRTSVDHGTAYDIAWQGRADSGSLRAALQLAQQLAHSRE